MASILRTLTRKKYVTFEDIKLNRVLTTVDLTLLGIGSTLGVGVYVLAGEVAKDTAGPAVVISFLIAAIASVFAGLCYAEFGARVPKAGSAYIYSYVCVGEFVAFVIGWNLILEYVIGAASVARGYSGYVNKLAGGAMADALTEAMPINVDMLSEYPDFFAFGMCLILSVILSIGVKESSFMNNIFTVVNLCVIIYTIIVGATIADVSNWSIPKESFNETCEDALNETQNIEQPFGVGGFAPFGFSGIMQGAATCFFGFVGFDCIATTGEEAKNPKKSIPIAIAVSLLVIFLGYFGMSSVLTLVVPYCVMDAEAPVVDMFQRHGMNIAKIIVSVGAIVAFSSSLFGAMFPMPRVIYAMASDGVIFRFLARINQRFKTPLVASLLSGLFAGLMAMLFDLSSLIDMMSIGTLMAYTIVALCVMLLRYSNQDMSFERTKEYALLRYDNEDDMEMSLVEREVSHKLAKNHIKYTVRDVGRQLLNMSRLTQPSSLSAAIASYGTLVFLVSCFALTMVLVSMMKQLSDGDIGAIVAVTILAVLTILIVIVVALQPQSHKELAFKVPLVPWMPALSSFINLYLMCNLSGATWARFAIWMAIGFLIYFAYGIWNSSQRTGNKPLAALTVVPTDPIVPKNGMTTFIIESEKVEPQILTLEQQDLTSATSSASAVPYIMVHLATPMSSVNSSVRSIKSVAKAMVPLESDRASLSSSSSSNDEEDETTRQMMVEQQVALALILNLDQKAQLAFTKEQIQSDLFAALEYNRPCQPTAKTNVEEPVHDDSSSSSYSESSSDDEEQQVDRVNRHIKKLDEIARSAFSAETVSKPQEIVPDRSSKNDCDEKVKMALITETMLNLDQIARSAFVIPPPSPTPSGRQRTGADLPRLAFNRLSSFELIPPSPSDSPMAQRIGEKFLLIPVTVPPEDSPPSSPGSPEIPIQFNYTAKNIFETKPVFQVGESSSKFSNSDHSVGLGEASKSDNENFASKLLPVKGLQQSDSFARFDPDSSKRESHGIVIKELMSNFSQLSHEKPSDDNNSNHSSSNSANLDSSIHSVPFSSTVLKEIPPDKGSEFTSIKRIEEVPIVPSKAAIGLHQPQSSSALKPSFSFGTWQKDDHATNIHALARDRIEKHQSMEAGNDPRDANKVDSTELQRHVRRPISSDENFIKLRSVFENK